MLLVILLVSIAGLFLSVLSFLTILERTRLILEMYERLIQMEGDIVDLTTAIDQQPFNMNIPNNDPPYNSTGTEGLRELFEQLSEDDDEDENEDEDEEGA